MPHSAPPGGAFGVHLICGATTTLFHVMSPSSLYTLSQRLRLLARRDIRLAADGRRLHGGINQALEIKRLQLEVLIDRLHDGQRLSKADLGFIEGLKDLLAQCAQQWRPLEREFA